MQEELTKERSERSKAAHSYEMAIVEIERAYQETIKDSEKRW